MQNFLSLLNRQTKFFYEEAVLDTSFRINALNKLLKHINEQEDNILKALKKDLGKSSYESFITEIGFVKHELNYVKRHLKKWTKPQKVSTPQKFLFYSSSKIQRVPHGQVLIYAPWNYPFQLLMSPLIGAIAAGNTAVLKPSEYAPAVADIIQDLIGNIFPDKYIAVVQGDAKVSQALADLDWDMIFFTGSTHIGRKIYEKAAQKLIPVVLELGGKCPALVHNDANIKVAARRIIWGKMLNAGQTCIAPDYLLVHERVKNRLLKTLSREINNMLGEDIKHTAAYARIVNRAHFERLQKLLEQSDIYYGGHSVAEDLFMEPTIVDNVQPSHPLMKEEIFGPILPVMTYTGTEEAIRFINGQHPPLAIYTFTKSNKLFEQIQRHTKSGAVVKNDTIVHLTNLNLPFGGVKQSGVGCYHGWYSFAAFSQERSLMKHSTSFDPSLRYPPYSAKKWKYIRKVFSS